MKTFLKTIRKNQSGASAAEYALIIAIVGTAMGLAAIALSTTITGSITGAKTEIKAVQDAA